MNMIETIKELKALEQQATPGKWYYWDADGEDFTAIATIPKSDDIADYDNEIIGASEWLRAKPKDLRVVVGLRNAAPAMLDVLSMIRPGDARLLEEIASVQEDMEKFMAGFGKPDTRQSSVLRRMQEMARKMEGYNQ